MRSVAMVAVAGQLPNLPMVQRAGCSPAMQTAGTPRDGRCTDPPEQAGDRALPAAAEQGFVRTDGVGARQTVRNPRSSGEFLLPCLLHPVRPGKLHMPEQLRFLIAESEPPQARESRRESVGRSSGETYVETLHLLAPDAVCHRVKPADRGAALPDQGAIRSYDAVFVTGSPLHLYQDTPETRREVELMRAVFAAGVPTFGSCAGLQVATVAAGGTVRPSRKGREAGFARRITLTDAGRDHPLLAGRPASFDAPAFHSDEVETLPERATLLASNTVTQVQAVEIRHGPGVFWGVQYHPELDLYEVAGALRRQAGELVREGFAGSHEALENYARMVEALHHAPEQRDLAWFLGLDEQVTTMGCRLTELRNFVRWAVELRQSQRT
jgi:GMP synthase (glutamine-hydrolysing)